MNNIASMTVKQKTENYEKMNRDHLMIYVKKLLYRISDLEEEKVKYLRTYNKKNESELEKYQKMLNEVKNVK